MAKKKTTTVTTSEVVIPEVETPEPAPTDLDSLDEWDVLDDSEGLKFQVHKMPTRAGEREAYCMTYTGTDLSLDAIRETFGGGTFRITARNAQNQYQGSKRVTIIDLPKPPVPAQGGEYLRRGESSQNESMGLMIKMFEQQGAMLTAMLTRPLPVAPAGPTALELVQLIKAMERKESDPITTLLKGLELGKQLGGGGGETSVMDLGMTALQALGPMIAAQAQKPAQPQKTLPAAAAAATNGAKAPAKETETPKQEGQEMGLLQKLEFLRVATAQLCVHARKGKRPDGEFVKDPDLYAEVFLDNIPEQILTLDEVIERMREPNAVEQLAQVNPQVKEFAEWFEAFRRACLDHVDEEGDEEGDEPEGGEAAPLEP